MTETEAETFVTRFAAAWAAKSGQAFLDLWWPDGELVSPFYDRPVRGEELGALNDVQAAQSPNLSWTLLGWTWRGDRVAVEWESANLYGERRVAWRGVDCFVLRGGRIVSEVVYADTALIHGMRAGAPLEPPVRLPASLL